MKRAGLCISGRGVVVVNLQGVMQAKFTSKPYFGQLTVSCQALCRGERASVGAYSSPIRSTAVLLLLRLSLLEVQSTRRCADSDDDSTSPYRAAQRPPLRIHGRVFRLPVILILIIVAKGAALCPRCARTRAGSARLTPSRTSTPLAFARCRPSPTHGRASIRPTHLCACCGQRLCCRAALLKSHKRSRSCLGLRIGGRRARGVRYFINCTVMGSVLLVSGCASSALSFCGAARTRFRR